MTDVYTKAKRSEIMSRVRNRRTTPEEQVASLLRKLGIRYRRNVKSLPGQPDFVVKSARTAIFVNGCFWHGHANCNRAKLPQTNTDFWVSKIARNKKRDARTTRQLRRQGWHVLTVWQCHLRRLEGVKERLRRVIAENDHFRAT